MLLMFANESVVWKVGEDCSCIHLWRMFWPDSFHCWIKST